MKRSSLNYAVDIVSLLAALGLISTGLLLRFVLPPGSRGGAGLSLWDWSRHDWGDVHFYIALGIGCLLIIHLALHWGWTWQITRRIFARNEAEAAHLSTWQRNIFGAGVLAVFVLAIGAFVYYAQGSVKLDGAARPRRGLEQQTIRAQETGDEGRNSRPSGPRRHRGNKAQSSGWSSDNGQSEYQNLAGGP